MDTLPVSHAGRRYGWKKDAYDGRDRLFARKPSATLPTVTNNRIYCGPIKDQGQEGSCTAHGWTAIWEMEFRKFLGQTPVFSPQFLYYLEREMEGTLPDDAGADSRTGARCITKYGLCLESDDPYDTSKMNVPPTAEQLADAIPWRSGAYHRLNNLLDIKSCLADQGPNIPGHPFTVGFMVYESFEGSAIEKTGLMPMPEAGESALGGHLVAAVDYDDSVKCPGAKAGAVLCQNSWGSWGTDAGTGKRGFFWMPYDYITDSSSAFDLWILHHGRPW
jgi:C1A family cysteine protease